MLRPSALPLHSAAQPSPEAGAKASAIGKRLQAADDEPPNDPQLIDTGDRVRCNHPSLYTITPRQRNHAASQVSQQGLVGP